ncbi:MAG: regulatory protein RecX [Alphaproteobacteria bacterium]
MAKKITQKRLENIALYYLQRYETSAFKLKSVLQKRLLRAKMQQVEVDENANAWIEEIVQKMQNLGYVDDSRYAQNQWRTLSSSGKSVRFICQKLKIAGIDEDTIQNLLKSQQETSFEMDLKAAQNLVKKRKLGKYHSPQDRKLMFQKDLAVLGRAGFSYETARQALEED